MAKLFDLPFGYVGTYDDNEIEIVSTIADPPKVRLAVEDGRVEGNLGFVSFNVKRADGRHEEWCGIGGRLIHDRTAGAIAIAVRGPGDDGIREAALFAPNGVVFNVPLLGQALAPIPALLRAPGGETELHIQGDGNLVVYDVRGPDGTREPDSRKWAVVWASHTGIT